MSEEESGSVNSNAVDLEFCNKILKSDRFKGLVPIIVMIDQKNYCRITSMKSRTSNSVLKILEQVEKNYKLLDGEKIIFIVIRQPIIHPQYLRKYTTIKNKKNNLHHKQVYNTSDGSNTKATDQQKRSQRRFSVNEDFVQLQKQDNKLN